MTAGELMDLGIRAYTRGELDDAERSWREVLELEPGNERARSYLELVAGKRPAAAVAQGAPVPLPAPGSAAPAARVSAPAPAAAPVPLPAPPAPAWMRSPITLPPTESPALHATGTATATPGVSSPSPWNDSPAPTRKQERATLSSYAPSPWDVGPALSPAVVLGEGVGLDLSSVAEQSDLRSLVPEAGGQASAMLQQKPRSEVEVWLEGARELFALGDFSGSLEMIEKILKLDPSHLEARDYLKQNEATLTAMYESKLGPGDCIPRLAIKPEEVMWLNLDHRAGFLLAQIDGTVSYEDLFALAGLPRLDTARILATLLQEGVITS